MGYVEDSPLAGTSDVEDSTVNYNEAFIVERVVDHYLSLGVKPEQIGVISPYWGQVHTLRTLMKDKPETNKVDVMTIDGFQGREKEMIIASFVRSNPHRQVGFLSDTRRINVAVTRAKRCCILIGDSETLSADSGLNNLITHCKKKGAVKRVQHVDYLT